MLEISSISSTVLKFATNPPAPPAASAASSRRSSRDSWLHDQQTCAIKLEACDDTYDSIHTSSASADFTELKPLPFDFGGSSSSNTPTLTDLDPVLSNNNSKGMTDMNMPNSRSRFHFNTSSDVTSSRGASSPPGITKLETLDFTASQDAFDDLASIVGISMGADSTVPNIDGDLDLDAWIENTAQNIKPLVGDSGLDTILPVNHRGGGLSNSSLHAAHSYLHMTSATGSTLQSLLQGNLIPGPPPPGCKVTQLQHRHGQQPLPPPYSILQNRLQHGLGGSLQVTPNNVVKVDSTFDLMKIVADNNNSNNAYLSSAAATSTAVSYADSLPHSTQSSINHVSTSDQSLHRRLGEIGGLAKIKAKQSKLRQKLGMSGGLSSPSSAGGGCIGGGGGGGGGDQGKKMMHHCQICNRGFLNKSNIKVHLRTHTGEKPFKCEHCSKAFRQKAHLLKHMSIHKRISRD